MADDQLRVARWECPNCGQSYFGDDPPDMCDFCEDFTTWRPFEPDTTPAPRRKPTLRQSTPRRAPESDERAHQPPLFDDSTGN